MSFLVSTSNIMGVQVWSEDMLKEARAEFETVNVRAILVIFYCPVAINTMPVSIIRSDNFYIKQL